MKKALIVVGIVCWVLVGSIMLSRWWHAHPDWFPLSPESWYWLDKQLNLQNADDVSDLEIIVVAAFSIAVVSFLTAIGIIFYRVVRRRIG